MSGVDGGEAVDRDACSQWWAMSNLSEMRFLTVAEVAAVMRVSRMTVYRLVHAGELASVKIGRSFRVPEAAVDAYLQRAYTEAG